MKGVKELLNCFHTVKRSLYLKEGAEKYYNVCFRELLRCNYNLDDTAFLCKVKKNKPAYFGVFISAAINKVIEDTDCVCLENVKKIDYLGMYLPRGQLIIKGKIGNFLGNKNSGEITVYGAAENFVGVDMEKGSIKILGRDRQGREIKGNKKTKVGDFVGSGMTGGKIEIFGDAGYCVGEKMEEGLIYIHGKVASIGRGEGGKIRVGEDTFYPERGRLVMILDLK